MILNVHKTAIHSGPQYKSGRSSCPLCRSVLMVDIDRLPVQADVLDALKKLSSEVAEVEARMYRLQKRLGNPTQLS
jgi:hypothetical protein